MMWQMRGYCPSIEISFSSIRSLNSQIQQRRLLILRMLRMMPPHQHRDRDRATGMDRHKELRLHDGVVVILVLATVGCQLMLDSRGVRVDP